VSAKLSQHLPKADPTIRDSAARTVSTWQPTSHFVGARPARLQLAVLAFKDVPVWPAVAHCANPLDEGGFRLEQVERVIAVARDRHDEGVAWSWAVSSAGILYGVGGTNAARPTRLRVGVRGTGS
jgi:hypothetical protein